MRRSVHARARECGRLNECTRTLVCRIPRGRGHGTAPRHEPRTRSVFSSSTAINFSCGLTCRRRWTHCATSATSRSGRSAVLAPPTTATERRTLPSCCRARTASRSVAPSRVRCSLPRGSPSGRPWSCFALNGSDQVCARSARASCVVAHLHPRCCYADAPTQGHSVRPPVHCGVYATSRIWCGGLKPARDPQWKRQRFP